MTEDAQPSASRPLPTPARSAEEVLIREFAEPDLEALLALFARCFHAPRSRKEWQRLYLHNPAGGPWSSVAVTSTDELVGHYGGYPVVFARHGAAGIEAVRAVQVGDTMTAPEVRRLGRGSTTVLARLAAHFYASAGPRATAFAYGFNTGAIHRFSLRSVGAQLFEPVRYRLLDTPRLPRAAAWRARVQRALGFRARVAAAFDSRFDALFARVASAYEYLVRRDEPYLRWRYALPGERGYRLIVLERGDELHGWGVFRRRDDRLTWGDALVDPAASGAASLLLAEALAAESAPLGSVDGWFSRHPGWWNDELERLGFRDAPEPQELAFVFVPLADPDPLPAFRSRLYYTSGDGDLF